MTVFTTVIVPVYNESCGIKKALEALVVQSFPRDKYEIVAVDNGSTDETPQIVARMSKQYPGLIKLVFERQTQGSYAARNQGIQAAKGDILAFTDADCVPTPDWLKSGVASLQEEGATCGGGRIEFTFRSGRPNIYEYLDSAQKLKQQTYVECSGFAATANFFARREVFSRYGLFMEELISGGDYEFGRRLTTHGEKLIYIENAVVFHPARASFSALYKKTKRVAVGQRALTRLGLLEHGSLSWRRLLPCASLPYRPEWDKMPRIQKLKGLAVCSLLRWRNFLTRVQD